MRPLPDLIAFILLLAVLSVPALAQEGFKYSPEGCEFEIVFPEEPYASRRCHDEMQERCDLMTTYTRVFDLDATINVYVSCRPLGEGNRAQFTPDMLRTSLLARPGVKDLEVYDITFQENEHALMGALLGAGPTANANHAMIYVAQIWVGDNSLFTLESELIGPQIEEVDRAFADILRSLHHKDWTPSETSEAEDGDRPEATPSEETKEP